MRILLGAVLVFLAGCAVQGNRPSAESIELQRYAQTQKPLAEAGQLKWSAYYSGLQDRYVSAHAPYEFTHLISDLHSSALQFENGDFSKDEFEARQRRVRALFEEISQRRMQEEQAKQQANMAMAMMFMQNRPLIPPLSLSPQLRTGGSLPITQSPPPASVYAFFTGQQRPVQTVTYQSGWDCEYRYGAQTFWRTFIGSCPSSVQVQ